MPQEENVYTGEGREELFSEIRGYLMDVDRELDKIKDSEENIHLKSALRLTKAAVYQLSAAVEFPPK